MLTEAEIQRNLDAVDDAVAQQRAGEQRPTVDEDEERPW